MGLGYVEVIVEDGDGGYDILDVVDSCGPISGLRQEGPDPKFGHGDCGDGDIVVILDDLVEIASRPFSIDQERRVEE